MQCNLLEAYLVGIASGMALAAGLSHFVGTVLLHRFRKRGE